MSFAENLAIYQSRVEQALDYWLPKSEIQPHTLHEAMRYAVLGQGKRIRPALVYSGGVAFGVNPEVLD